MYSCSFYLEKHYKVYRKAKNVIWRHRASIRTRYGRDLGITRLRMENMPKRIWEGQEGLRIWLLKKHNYAGMHKAVWRVKNVRESELESEGYQKQNRWCETSWSWINKRNEWHHYIGLFRRVDPGVTHVVFQFSFATVEVQNKPSWDVPQWYADCFELKATLTT